MLVHGRLSLADVMLLPASVHGPMLKLAREKSGAATSSAESGP
jgi:hypothetical protein